MGRLNGLYTHLVVKKHVPKRTKNVSEQM